MDNYMIIISAKERVLLARLLKQEHKELKKAFGALPLGDELLDEVETLHMKLRNSVPVVASES